MNIGPKTWESALVALAEKLGTTTEYLWEVLVRQAFVEMVRVSIVATALAVGMGCLIPYVRRRIPQIDDEQIRGVLWVFFWTGIFCGGIIVLQLLSTAMIAAVNPEYWALWKVLSALRH